MHSPKKKKNLSSNTHANVQNGYRFSLSYQEKRRGREDRIERLFYTMQRIKPLDSTVSITSMLYCIYRQILLL
ncbi:unnamed protein product [Staurois parvus]|uniref:Uncharacterized protein n=1 Tax=Staurois parvus TaxID=386267 RepID=A0ABN9C3M4_9NEOB|nr:unnamed protein product [Staurois parvus]